MIVYVSEKSFSYYKILYIVENSHNNLVFLKNSSEIFRGNVKFIVKEEMKHYINKKCQIK